MADCTPAIYKRRRPETSSLYKIIQENFQSWHEEFVLRHEEALPNYVEREFRGYIKCGILAYGFARARCPDCQHEFLIAFSCKAKSLCPSCCSKYMAQTAMHLIEDVLPMLPVRQYVLSLPKVIRFYVARNNELLSKVLKIYTQRGSFLGI